MKLYGHDMSPYVRRVRVLLTELGLPFERDANGWSNPSEAFLRINPLLRVPALEDDGEVLLDSKQIATYLYDRHGAARAPRDLAPPLQPTLFRPARRYQDENLLLAIDAATDSLINVFLLELDGVPASSAAYLRRQGARAASCLAFVEDAYAGRETLGDALSFVDIALTCALDWMAFRKRYDVTAHPGLARVLAAHRERESFAATHPSRAASAALPYTPPGSKA